MQYFTIVDNSYEEAVNKAKELYGENIRIHSRRDFTTSGGLFTRKQHKCEISCYTLDAPVQAESKAKEKDLDEFEKEARTPDPSKLTLKERLDTDIHRNTSNAFELASGILDENYITGALKSDILSGLTSGIDDVQSYISEKLASLIPIAYEEQVHPSRYMVFIGPTGTGKTTTVAKIAALYKKQGKKVAIITLDSYRVGAYEQIKAFGDVLDIPVDLVKEENEVIRKLDYYSWYDLILIDTMGLSHKDRSVALRLKGLTSMLDRNKTKYVFTASSSMKEEDLTEHFLRYKDYSPSAMICTKLDESETMGNVLSFAYKLDLPLLFLTDGQEVPGDLIVAGSIAMLPYLKGVSFNKEATDSQLIRNKE